MLTPQLREVLKIGMGGSYSDARDAIKHNLWDTRFFGTTVTDNTFFIQPVSSSWNGTTKTQNETNIFGNGTLPNGQTFLATGMGVKCISNFNMTNTPDTNGAAVLQSFINMLQNSYFEITIKGREFDFQCHGSQFLPSLTLSSQTAEGATTATNMVKYGDSIASGILKFPEAPVFIDTLVNFEVSQKVGSAITAVNTQLASDFTVLNDDNALLMVFLEGYLTRAK